MSRNTPPTTEPAVETGNVEVSGERFRVARLNQIDPVACPCGLARRAFTEDEDRPASLHVTEILEDSRVHYHRKTTELYYVLEGKGLIELDGGMFPLEPGVGILIKPGCRHRAVGRMKVLIVAIPTFDAADEWFD